MAGLTALTAIEPLGARINCATRQFLEESRQMHKIACLPGPRMRFDQLKRRAVSKIQLLNGFADVREGIEEMMQRSRNAESP
jgi:hypothetical protein